MASISRFDWVVPRDEEMITGLWTRLWPVRFGAAEDGAIRRFNFAGE